MYRYDRTPKLSGNGPETRLHFWQHFHNANFSTSGVVLQVFSCQGVEHHISQLVALSSPLMAIWRVQLGMLTPPLLTWSTTSILLHYSNKCRFTISLVGLGLTSPDPLHTCRGSGHKTIRNWWLWYYVTKHWLMSKSHTVAGDASKEH